MNPNFCSSRNSNLEVESYDSYKEKLFNSNIEKLENILINISSSSLKSEDKKELLTKLIIDLAKKLGEIL